MTDGRKDTGATVRVRLLPKTFSFSVKYLNQEKIKLTSIFNPNFELVRVKQMWVTVHQTDTH